MNCTYRRINMVIISIRAGFFFFILAFALRSMCLCRVKMPQIPILRTARCEILSVECFETLANVVRRNLTRCRQSRGWRAFLVCGFSSRSFGRNYAHYLGYWFGERLVGRIEEKKKTNINFWFFLKFIFDFQFFMKLNFFCYFFLKNLILLL